LAPENTLAALGKALEHGVDEIEVDVRITADGVAVLHHDLSVRDAAGTALAISRHSLEELRRHKPDLALLEDAIRTVGRRVPLQLEVKWGEDTGPVIDVVQSFLADGWQASDFLFGSKKQRTLLELHRALPEVPVVVIEPFFSLRARLRCRQLGSKRISMNHIGLWPFFIRAMSRSDYELYAYTLNDPAKARSWHSYGLAGVITDDPSDFGQ
jgi:glycerophosphoryl diester phosphodiesterase